jgi:Fe-S-cluster-containing dehydrogenase component
MDAAARLMKKCNLCYDRTVQNLQPWCAQACPTQALWYGDYEAFVATRKGHPVRHTVFGAQEVRTRVYHVLPEGQPKLDLVALLEEAREEVARIGEAQEAGEVRGEGGEGDPWVL